MGKKKITLVSKVQLREALRLHALSRSGEVGKAGTTEKGQGSTAKGVMAKPISQIPPESPSVESSEESGSLVTRKRRRLGKCLSFVVTRLSVLFMTPMCAAVIDDKALKEGTSTEVVGPVVEIMESPRRANKGKVVGTLTEEEAVEAADLARGFLCQRSRGSGSETPVASKFSIEVPASLEGLNPCYRPENLVEARRKRHAECFAELGMDVSEAFDPVPNILNSESILFDESDLGSRLMESFALPRDRHAMCHSEGSTGDFAEKIYRSLAVVSLYGPWYSKEF